MGLGLGGAECRWSARRPAAMSSVLGKQCIVHCGIQMRKTRSFLSSVSPSLAPTKAIPAYLRTANRPTANRSSVLGFSLITMLALALALPRSSLYAVRSPLSS